MVNAYLSTLDFNDRIEIVQELQAELHAEIPVIPILYPHSHWGYSEQLYNIDFLLLSLSALEWNEVIKSDVPITTNDIIISDDCTCDSDPNISIDPKTNEFDLPFYSPFIVILFPIVLFIIRKRYLRSKAYEKRYSQQLFFTRDIL